MSGFNVSARKEDMSMRLRAQNLRNARDQTKRLEDDNRKMEDRLRELKTAMTREKEERERQGGGFWGRGQTNTGSLTNYATEVLHNKAEKPPKEGKKKKVKVLQDQPIEVPKRSSQPGTMKYIAQRKLTSGSTPRDKLKGPRCGQCEDRTATLSCMQCSEIYCPGCFAAFHLKGALKQHRSVPISASGPRVCMSPSPSSAAPSPRGGQASGAIVSHTMSSDNGSEASGPSPSHSSPRDSVNSLLQGNYDESQSAASFQAALMAWRQGEEPSDSSPEQRSPRKPIASPIKSPVVAVDESTGTVEESKALEIKFTHTLSYAERLMLKKHRRTELAEMHTPRLEGQGQAGMPELSLRSDRHERKLSGRASGRPGSSGLFATGRSVNAGRSEKDMTVSRQDTMIDDEERVDFHALFDAVVASESPDQKARTISSQSCVSVTEMPSDTVTTSDVPRLKPSATYVVEEVSPFESWRTQHKNKMGPASSSTFVIDGPQKSRSDDASQRKKINTITELYTVDDDVVDGSATPSRPTHSPVSGSDGRHSNFSHPEPDSDFSIGSRHVQNKSQAEQRKDPSLGQETVDVFGENEKPLKTPRAKSAKSRPTSSLSRANKSRPGSRAQSRAGSRMEVEGLLTKTPSEALKRIVQMEPAAEYSYRSPMEDFFLVGVEGEQPKPVENRVLTPSNARKPTSRPVSRAGAKSATLEKATVKVSYKLYQMAPRSWRPDSSLGETVPVDQVRLDAPEDEEITLSYSYSRQLDGHAVDVRTDSSLSRVDMPSDDLGLNAVGVFGDELFTDLAAGTPTPRAVSALRSRLSMDRGDSATPVARDSPVPSSRLSARQKSLARRSKDTATPTNQSVFPEERVPTPPSSSHGARIGSATPVRDRLRRKSDMRRNNESTDEGRDSVTPTPVATREGHRILPSRPGSQHFRKEKFGNLTDSASHREHSQIQADSGSSRHSPRGAKSNVGRELSGLSRQGTADSFKSSQQRPVSRHTSDVSVTRRPISSTHFPSSAQARTSQQQSQDQRPNSSTGGADQLRRTQPTALSYSRDDHPDTVVADLMMSRVREDNWMSGSDDGSELDNKLQDSSSYADNDIKAQPSSSSSLQRKLQSPAISGTKERQHWKVDSSHWETEVRPFSGVSMDSRTGGSPSPSRVNSAREVKGHDRSMSSLSRASGRESRAVVMEGEDLSCYDDMGVKDEQNMEDKQALDQLEWELASDTGRLTADGQVSRMSVLDNDDDVVSSSSSRSSTRSLQMGMDKELDISAKIQEDEKLAQADVDDKEAVHDQMVDEDDVRALR
ncbi:uncharacterized protein LOC101863985 [Aplysia californica]|uniref:Uncharacterized protein LOC101863985 n=1 Tax=Aplysia californica TaxID=6500 RepID=A0ABM1A0P2_APLCA|nr:uncharacterized protein LOC101863985 [Aplysia californica]